MGLTHIESESESEVAQLCLTFCDPMDCSLPGSSVHEIFQARVLEWGAVSFSRRSSQPRDRTWVSCIVGRCFTICANFPVSLVAQMVKHLSTMWETQVRSLGGEDLLEKEMATHSGILAWRIPWTEEPGRLQSMGLQRVRHN